MATNTIFSRHRSTSLFGLIIKQTEQPIPLKEVSVEAEIKACLLGLKSVLKYTNDSSDPAEVLFRFPVEESSAVVGLTAIIDGRRIKADIKEKEEARAAYDDAIASGQSAALGEEKTGDVFSITLGNLSPQKDAEIHLQVVAELPIDAEENVRFSLPSVFKSRYTPTGSSDPLANVSDSGSQVSSAHSSSYSRFQLNILEPQRIATIVSPTHTLNCTNGEDKIEVTLSDQKPADKDLVVLIQHKEPYQPCAVVEEGTDTGFMSQKAVMVNFFPKFDQLENDCEFIFLVDRSGSMSGQFIQSASETLILFMKSLPENCYFNIVGFGSRYEQLFPEVSVPYSQSTLDKAVAHLTGLQANLGGTELLSPLDFIFKSKPQGGLSRQVFVLTDGAVSNTDACVQMVKQNNKSARCFTFGIGSGVSTALVEGLAHAGNGSAEFVKEGERLQPKVIRSLKRALQPALTDVSLEFKIDGKPEILQCPQTLPPIFAGEKLVVYALVKAKSDKLTGKAVLKGKLLQKSISDTVEFKSGAGELPPVSTVHHLAAKALIKDWEHEGKDSREIVKLSVESSVVSSRTAFIAVDEENLKPIEGALKTFVVQAKAPYTFQRQVHGGYPTKKRKRSTSRDRKKSNKKAPTKKMQVCGDMGDVQGGPPMLSFVVAKGSRSKSGAERCEYQRQSQCDNALLDYDEDSDDDSESVNESTSLQSTLSSIIGAQQADGSWKINSALARFVGKTLQEVESGCPTECQGVTALLWATLLILELLHTQYVDDLEEWELVGAKAEAWTKKQSISPGDTSLDNMKVAANKFLA